MTAKEYLQQVKRKDVAISNLQQDILELKENMMSIGGMTYGDKIQSTKETDRFGELYSRIDQKQKILSDKLIECIDFKMKITDEINALDDDRYIRVLYNRYVKLISWLEVSDEMGYSDSSGAGRYAQQLHGQALIEFEKVHHNQLVTYDGI